MTAVDLLMGFAKMSVFMCFAQLLRSRVKLLQKILMPSSVVAGLLCLLLGPQFLDVLHFSEAASEYPSVLIATGGGFYLNRLLHEVLPQLSLPTFSLGMLCALALQFVLNKLHLGQYVHHSVTNRIGNTATDYLVGFAVASIKVSVIVKYAVPLLVISLIGLAGVIFYLLVICPRLFRNFWFERGIFIFGWSTGVCAIGITLLRVVDPYSKSRTLEDYSMAYMFISLLETAMIAVMPAIVVAGYQYAAGGICLVVFALLLLTCAKLYGVFKGRYSDLRPGEEEVINDR